jgi:hypothetical protein
MKKLSLAFALLTSATLLGTATADDNHRDDGSDRRTTIIEHGTDTGNGRIIVRDRRAPHAPAPIMQPAPFMPAPASTFQRPAAQRWELLTVKAAGARRGMLSLSVPARQSFDQLRLIPSASGVDILGIELDYGRGRTERVRPGSDGLVTLDLGRGKLKSIAVHYVNRGAGRDATIKVLGKDDGKLADNGRDDGRRRY